MLLATPKLDVTPTVVLVPDATGVKVKGTLVAPGLMVTEAGTVPAPVLLDEEIRRHCGGSPGQRLEPYIVAAGVQFGGINGPVALGSRRQGYVGAWSARSQRSHITSPDFDSVSEAFRFLNRVALAV